MLGFQLLGLLLRSTYRDLAFRMDAHQALNFFSLIRQPRVLTQKFPRTYNDHSLASPDNENALLAWRGVRAGGGRWAVRGGRRTSP